MPDLATLTTAAVEAGLVLLPCHVCNGRRLDSRPCTWCSRNERYPDDYTHHDRHDGEEWTCHGCAGTGQDRAPGALLMALLLATPAVFVSPVYGLPGPVGKLVPLWHYTVRGLGHCYAEVPRGGGPTEHAAAALTAWLRAHGREVPHA